MPHKESEYLTWGTLLSRRPPSWHLGLAFSLSVMPATGACPKNVILRRTPKNLKDAYYSDQELLHGVYTEPFDYAQDRLHRSVQNDRGIFTHCSDRLTELASRTFYATQVSDEGLDTESESGVTCGSLAWV